MTLTTTPASPSADAYIDEAWADAYHQDRLHNDLWLDTATTTAKKEAAIKWATRVLDQQAWLGYRTTELQALRWPRSGVADLDGYDYDDKTIPAFLKNATAELAYHLLVEDRTADNDTAGFKKINVGPISLDVDKRDRIDALPVSVQDIIRPFVSGGLATGIGMAKIMRS